MFNSLFFLFILIGYAVTYEEKYKLCANELINLNSCASLERGNSKVKCEHVIDHAECAIKLAEGKADFAVFDTEEMILAHQFYPDSLRAVFELRHLDRPDKKYEFESVVVVPSSFDDNNGLEGLKGFGLCHPGFSESQQWSDGILKYFESRVYRNECHRKNVTATENELKNLESFFGHACRPGEWVSGKEEDKTFKSQFPELCSLCNNNKTCEYDNPTHHGHIGALDCLVNGNDKHVAYVAHEYVQDYFKLNSNSSLEPLSIPLGFKFLCQDGSSKPLTSKDPCGWIRQPWNAIVTRKEKADNLRDELQEWLNKPITYAGPPDWTQVLRDIVAPNANAIQLSSPHTLKNYLTKKRVDLPENNPCGKTMRWCTVNSKEKQKCEWIAKEAIMGAAIVPYIECVKKNSTFDCLKSIAREEADLITIDSNYGWIAQKVYNLTPVMYAETSDDDESQVVAVVLDKSKLKSFNDLEKGKACFPEYGGIAWLSFLNMARSKELISDSCKYDEIVSEFLEGACAPGIRDNDHSKEPPSDGVTNILCSLCPIEEHTNATCSANRNNTFYGDKGALECVKSRTGDIAFIEPRNLKTYIQNRQINPKDFRVLCKNGSLATYTGFDVDKPCSLSLTIDSMVIARKQNSDKKSDQVYREDISLALLKLEDWLGYRDNVRRPINLYKSFEGSSDLLFKDSTSGLVSESSDITSVKLYKELLEHVGDCSGVEKIVANFALILGVSIFFARFF